MNSDSPKASGNSSKKLETWKEIAHSLGVNTRTAQIWEAERGLPVYRQPGLRGRVWAWDHELAEWMERLDNGAKGERPAADALASGAPRPAWRRVLLPLAAAAVFLAALGGYGLARREPNQAAVRCTVDGTIITALDAAGRTVWQRPLPAIPDDFDRTQELLGFSAPDFVDLDGTGSKVLLFPYRRLTTGEDQLYCFEADGRPRWSFGMTERPRLAGMTQDAHYGLRSVRLLPRRKGGADVLATFSHDKDEQAVLVRLNAAGHRTGTYWHAGHLTNINTSDLDGDGREEILLTGCANGYQRGDLIVLDADRLDGASREANAEHQILNAPLDRERARLLFQRTRLGRTHGSYACALEVRAGQGVLTVALEDAGLGSPPGESGQYYVQLDAGLAPTAVRFSDALNISYRRLFNLGMLRKSSPAGEERELMVVERVTRPETNQANSHHSN